MVFKMEGAVPRFVKISIIVPVYNAGEGLKRCLDCLLSQTLRDVEIIIVCDCPTDGSDEVAREYAARDNRVVLIENERNLNVSLSRNAGLAVAKGEYVGFSDHDDYCSSEMYGKLYEAAKAADADVAASDMYEEDGTSCRRYAFPAVKDGKVDPAAFADESGHGASGHGTVTPVFRFRVNVGEHGDAFSESRRQRTVVLERPDGKIVVFRQAFDSGFSCQRTVAARIDEALGGDDAASAGVLDNCAAQRIPGRIQDGVAYQSVIPELDAVLFQKFVQGQDERRRREDRPVAARFGRSPLVSPVRWNISGTILNGSVQQFLGNPERNLSAVSVAQRQIDENQSGCRQTAGQNRFFYQGDFFPASCTLEGCRNSGNSAADHDNVIFSLEVAFHFFSLFP